MALKQLCPADPFFEACRSLTICLAASEIYQGSNRASDTIHRTES